ncbi:MAG: hypothetical protein U0O14_08570, partial [Oscillospiraceae bacterium]
AAKAVVHSARAMTMASTVAMIFFMFVSSIKICLCPVRLHPPRQRLQRKHHYVVDRRPEQLGFAFHGCKYTTSRR